MISGPIPQNLIFDQLKVPLTEQPESRKTTSKAIKQNTDENGKILQHIKKTSDRSFLR